MTDRLRAWWPAVLIGSGLVAAIVAFVAHRLWRVLPWERFALSLVLALLAMAVAWGLRRATRWSMASCLLLAWLLALLYFVGPAPVLAVSLLAAAVLALGLRLAPYGPGHAVIALVAGLMLVAGASGWLLMLPVHHLLVWGAVLVAMMLSNRAGLSRTYRDLRSGWAREVVAAPRWAAFAVLLIGLASTACWLPTMQVDDLAYHLGLPSQLRAHAVYAPSAQHQIWSFAPWAGDALQGVAAVLARTDARGALDALWLALAAAAAWATSARLSANATERWACVALLASFPPLVWLAAGMQTELPAMAVLLALAATVLPAPVVERDPDDRPGQRVLIAAVLFGGLLALKPMHALSALPLLAYAGWCHRAHWPWRRLLVAFAIVVLVGGSSYWFAWIHTGNPVLPLFNATFASPYFPLRDFDDSRWHAGFGPWLVWQMSVDTDRYLEAWDGGLGLGLITLSGVWLLALLRREARLLSIAATLTMLLPLLPLQYARYAEPGMVVVLAALLPRSEAAMGRRFFAIAMVSLCIVNLAFQANSGWTQHSSALKRTLRTGGNATEVLLHYVPERVLIAGLPRGDDGIVLATDPLRPYIAELGGRGRTVSAHDPTLHDARIAADADVSGARWRALFVSSGARWLLVTPASASPALQRALVDSAAVRTASAGDAELWRLRDAGASPR